MKFNINHPFRSSLIEYSQSGNPLLNQVNAVVFSKGKTKSDKIRKLDLSNIKYVTNNIYHIYKPRLNNINSAKLYILSPKVIILNRWKKRKEFNLFWTPNFLNFKKASLKIKKKHKTRNKYYIRRLSNFNNKIINRLHFKNRVLSRKIKDSIRRSIRYN